MPTLEDIQAFFQKDVFATQMGATIVSAKAGDALCRLVLTPSHRNAGGAVQGGVLFTLADFAFAVAANCGGIFTVSLDSNIAFVSQPKGEILFAHAVLRSETKHVVFYDIEVSDELDHLTAKIAATGYLTNRVCPL